MAQNDVMDININDAMILSFWVTDHLLEHKINVPLPWIPIAPLYMQNILIDIISVAEMINVEQLQHKKQRG